MEAVDPSKQIDTDESKGTDAVEMTTHDEESLPNLDAASERRLKWKLDLFILPLISTIAFFAYVGRSDLGNAKIAGLSEELELSPKDYSNSATVLLVGYIVFQLPGTLLLKKIGPSRQFFGAMVVWGTLTAITVVVTNKAGLMALRFFTGAAEAFVQGVVFYLSFWYEIHELTTRGAIYYSTSTLAGAFNGLIAYAVQKNLDGARGWRAWRWLFLIEGLLPVAFGFVVLILLPDGPEKVRFGFNKSEKGRLIQRSRNANNSIEERLEMRRILPVLIDVRFWLYTLIAAGGHFAVESFSSFLPSLINDFGYSSSSAQAFSVIVYAAGLLGVLFWSRLADMTKERGLVLVASTSGAIVGYALLIGLTSRNGRFAATIVAAFCVYANIVLVLVWAAANFVGYTRRGSVLAFLNIFPLLFAISATQAYSDPPLYRKGNGVALGLEVVVLISTIVLRWYLIHLNRKKAGSSTAGEPISAEGLEELGDRHPNFMYPL